MSLPDIVSPTEWQAARDTLLLKEKAATHALDDLAAERRRLPMVAFEHDYAFIGPDGPLSLVDAFAGRPQLIVYHFMPFGQSDPCVGCSGFTDNVPRLEHLNARDVTFALISHTPLETIEAYKARMGWTMPFYSSYGSDFDADCGLTGGFGLSVFLRDGTRVFRSYFTTGRGVDRLRLDMNLLDLAPYGRQEAWEDTPEGFPQSPPMTWWRRHDEYEHA